MKRIYLLAALFLASAAFATTSYEWRVTLVRTGSTTVGTFTGATADQAYLNCQKAAEPLGARTTGYDCQTPRLHITVTADPPPPPVCTTPKPADETRPGTCSAGTIGTWSQSRSYVSADYPTCWTAGPWMPDSAPPGTCSTPPPPPIDCVVNDVKVVSDWSACVNSVQTRTTTWSRTVVTPASNGGAECPALADPVVESRSCTVDPPLPPTPDAIFVNAGESISTAVAKLAPGGTVIVRPGTYAAFSPKACTAAAYCTIKAETDGTVNVTGLNIGAGNWYTRLEGLKFTGNSTKVIVGSFVKVFRTSISGGASSGNDVTLQIGTNDRTPGASNILLEDVWVYGPGGRYKVLVYNAQKVVLRRVITRHDGGWAYDGDNPQGGFALYDSVDVACQDCFYGDSVQSLNGFESALYLVSNSTTSQRQSNVSVNGAIIIGSANNGIGAEGTGSAATYTLTDVAIVGSKAGGLNTNNSAHVINASRVTCSVTGTCFGNWAKAGSIKVNDCKFGKGTLSSGASLTKCPGGTGAKLDFKIGVSGTLFGEPGYDQVLADPLWPYPNEARIKTDFDAVRPAFGGLSVTDYLKQALQ